MTTEQPPDPLKPSPTLLCKLGSVIVHADELLSPRGHAFDKIAMESAIRDPEVLQWLEQMGKMAMIPLKRRRADEK